MTIKEKIKTDTTMEFLDDYVWDFVDVGDASELIENLEFICSEWPGEPELILTLFRSYRSDTVTNSLNM